jgi:hypothetical protein
MSALQYLADEVEREVGKENYYMEYCKDKINFKQGDLGKNNEGIIAHVMPLFIGDNKQGSIFIRDANQITIKYIELIARIVTSFIQGKEHKPKINESEKRLIGINYIIQSITEDMRHLNSQWSIASNQ